MSERLADHPEETDFLERTNRGLARLHFGEVLHGSNWLTETNRDFARLRMIESVA